MEKKVLDNYADKLYKEWYEDYSADCEIYTDQDAQDCFEEWVDSFDSFNIVDMCNMYPLMKDEDDENEWDSFANELKGYIHKSYQCGYDAEYENSDPVAEWRSDYYNNIL